MYRHLALQEVTKGFTNLDKSDGHVTVLRHQRNNGMIIRSCRTLIEWIPECWNKPQQLIPITTYWTTTISLPEGIIICCTGNYSTVRYQSFCVTNPGEYSNLTQSSRCSAGLSGRSRDHRSYSNRYTLLWLPIACQVEIVGTQPMEAIFCHHLIIFLSGKPLKSLRQRSTA